MIYTHVAAALVALALGFGGGWQTQDWRFTAQVSKLEKKHAEATAQAVTEALDETVRHQKAKDAALRNAQARAKRDAADAADARLVADGLRSDLDTQRMHMLDAARSALLEYASAANLVFGECSRRLEEMGRAAQGHSSDVRTLTEAWPKR